MIIFLSTTQLYEFHVKIYHSSRSMDLICNFLITEYSNQKRHKYQAHYIQQSKKDSVIVSTDVTCNWIAPRIMHYISFALHFICITLHLHLKIMPRQHEMHDTSRFKCHALHLHFMK